MSTQGNDPTHCSHTLTLLYLHLHTLYSRTLEAQPSLTATTMIVADDQSSDPTTMRKEEEEGDDGKMIIPLYTSLSQSLYLCWDYDQ